MINRHELVNVIVMSEVYHSNYSFRKSMSQLTANGGERLRKRPMIKQTKI